MITDFRANKACTSGGISGGSDGRGIRWRGIAVTAMIEILVLFVFAFAVVRYVEWSSDANQAEFMSGRFIRIYSS